MGNSLPNPKEVGRLYALAQIGFEMAAPIGVGALLDNSFGWNPWGVVVGAVLGLIGGMAHLIFLVNRKAPDPPSQPPRGSA